VRIKISYGTFLHENWCYPFKEKGDIDTIGLFAEISKRVLKSVDKHFWLNTESPSHKRFKFMLKEFEELSQPYLSSQEAYLLMMLSGSCLGAVYFQHLYPYCITIVMKMTIENSNLAKLDPSNKYYFFLLFSSFFIQDILKSEDLVNEGIIYYKTKKDEKDFDIFSFVKNAINSQLPNGAKQ
jgi:hypothetical protein